MGRLTTHVLDTARGVPGVGMRVELYALSPKFEKLKAIAMNGDGRSDAPLLEGADLKVGQYELVFRAGDYFRETGLDLSEPAFLDEIPIRFAVADIGAHYHVPLLVTPWSYSTYRGS
ncbi:MAG TPA: hydroxyisourate hydrolase [Alphaproteobacteria bacterium]|nr:hydroxyisourate hydrolase [Alphaproteobacteria bacterium]